MNQCSIDYDWQHLSNNLDIRDKFTITLRNRFNQLQDEENDLNPNNTYINFMNAHKQAAEDCIPLKPKIKHRVLFIYYYYSFIFSW